MMKQTLSAALMMSSAWAVSMIPATASANAYDFATKGVCDVVTCTAKPSEFRVAVPAGAGAQDWSRTDLTPVRIEARSTAEFAAMEADDKERCQRVPSGATAYEWATMSPC